MLAHFYIKIYFHNWVVYPVNSINIERRGTLDTKNIDTGLASIVYPLIRKNCNNMNEKLTSIHIEFTNPR